MHNDINRWAQSFRTLKGRFCLKITDRIDLYKTRSIDISDCKAVCLTLGPYRNLTTLTAATLFLHPNCQVLNHAGSRVFGNAKVDFLSNFNLERFSRFIQFAIGISKKGQGGSLGGSILYSHAFDSKHKMRDYYQKAGSRTTKSKVTSLLWKESLQTSNWIRKHQFNFQDVFKKEERLRFLLPIRNPMDCALSNMRTGHVKIFEGLNKKSSSHEVVQAVLDEIFWFASCQERAPERFYCFFEHSISRKVFVDLAAFLELGHDETWLSHAEQVMVPYSKYRHEKELNDFYIATVKRQFENYPFLRDELLAFAAAQ